MTRFGALVGIFLRDLVRRRMVWVLAVITVGIIAVNYGIGRTVGEAIGEGESWDLATRRAASHLDDLASTIRGWLAFATALLAAQVAPESRRNGTTQFVLSVGVDRNTLAAAQFAALACLIGGATVILHVGFAVAGVWTGALTGQEAAFAWAGLAALLLAYAAAVFCVSLTASPMETYLVFIAVPLLTRTLPLLAHGFPKGCPVAFVRAIDNLSLFFPEIDEITPWPHLSYGTANGAPYPQWQWAVCHIVAAAAFWVVLGVWLQRHHDFGSRTAVK